MIIKFYDSLDNLYKLFNLPDLDLIKFMRELKPNLNLSDNIEIISKEIKCNPWTMIIEVK